MTKLDLKDAIEMVTGRCTLSKLLFRMALPDTPLFAKAEETPHHILCEYNILYGFRYGGI